MTGLIQSFSDLKLIVTTDHRVWACAGFLCLVTAIWFATEYWREPVPPPPEKIRKMLVEDDRYKTMIGQFTTAVRESKEERQFLKDSLSRVTQEFGVVKQEVDWHTDTLITKLNEMTEKVDRLVTKVGESHIANAQLEQKIAKAKKKDKKKRVHIDSMDLK